jgi:aromatic ring-cleaving dioxygenase
MTVVQIAGIQNRSLQPHEKDMYSYAFKEALAIRNAVE